MGGPGGGYRTMTEEEMQELFGNEDPFSDFFNTFFGGGGAGAREAAGRTRPRRRDPEGPRHRARGRADARGGVPRRDASHLDQAGRPRPQRRRAHSGRREGRLARARRGRGRIGQPTAAPPAICTCACRSRPHPVFERKGDDLHTTVAVPVTTAVLGGEAQVPTITGTVRLKIPETTQNGQVFRLKGHGMPVVGKPDTRGDLYATVDVQLPRSLTKEQREHYERLAKLEKLSDVADEPTRA